MKQSKPASSSTEQTETEADGDDCGGSESARNSDPDPEIYNPSLKGRTYSDMQQWRVTKYIYSSICI